MVEVYNFLAAWQLFPEKGTYEFGNRPKSGIYKIELGGTGKELAISMNWVSLEDQAFSSNYTVLADGDDHEFENKEVADFAKIKLIDSANFETYFFKEHRIVLTVIHEITPKGYLKVTQKRFVENEKELINIEIYHKQLSVLPYSASVSGAVIKPNEEGIIRHQALSAMEEQTNMQLTQIRQQIELLAIQAKEIQKRKELSMLIYDAKLSFAPVIGKVYYLYEKEDGAYLVSMIGPKEWGRKTPYKTFISAIQLLADHTWKEI
jgi:predicted transcriptional regulator